MEGADETTVLWRLPKLGTLTVTITMSVDQRCSYQANILFMRSMLDVET